MPVTLSYDLTNIDGNDRTYIRSALERFGWKRMGGSVFRYQGTPDADGVLQEDWLNHVAPALMFVRSFIVARGITLTRFTLDASSVANLDQSDTSLLLGIPPSAGADLSLQQPTNPQASEKKLRDFVDAAIQATR